MSRYIDAEELLKVSFKNPIGLTAFQGIIKRQPTVDVVEVVRCKDCKHYKLRNVSPKYNPKIKCCMRMASQKFSKDGYCSYGERREDEPDKKM